MEQCWLCPVLGCDGMHSAQWAESVFRTESVVELCDTTQAQIPVIWNVFLVRECLKSFPISHDRHTAFNCVTPYEFMTHSL